MPSIDKHQQVSMDTQSQSPMFRLPVEIRRQVYSYIVLDGVHVYLDEDKLCVSTCVTSKPGDDFFCFDRRSMGDPPAAVWARRLMSSWASHWRCEELAKCLDLDKINIKTQHDVARALMKSCRRILDDVLCYVAETSFMHVTDLATLDVLFKYSHRSGFQSNDPEHLLISAFMRARRLSITFRPSPQVYKAVEYQINNLGSPCCLKSSSPAAIWDRTWINLASLPYLRLLHVYLDHDSQSSWSIIDERAILSPLLPLTYNQNLTTMISIPSLPPRVAGVRSRFKPESDPLFSFQIKRFTRQRFFSEHRKDGSFGIVYEDDAHDMFHIPGPVGDELMQAAEMTMHVWLHGIDLNYLSLTESLENEMNLAY